MQQPASQSGKFYEAPKIVTCGSIADLTKALHVKTGSPEPSTALPEIGSPEPSTSDAN